MATLVNNVWPGVNDMVCNNESQDCITVISKRCIDLMKAIEIYSPLRKKNKEGVGVASTMVV